MNSHYPQQNGPHSHVHEAKLGGQAANIMVRAVGFLNTPSWAGLTLIFSFCWVIAAAYVCYINYFSTYAGIIAFFPGLDVGVVIAFVVFVQGAEFIIPIIEGSDLYQEMGDGWKDGFRLTWVFVVVVDYITAFVWFCGKAGITMDNAPKWLIDNPFKLVALILASLFFSIIFLIAEVLLVLGFRALMHTAKKLLVSWHVIEDHSESHRPEQGADPHAAGHNDPHAAGHNDPHAAAPAELANAPAGWQVRPSSYPGGAWNVYPPRASGVRPFIWRPGMPRPSSFG